MRLGGAEDEIVALSLIPLLMKAVKCKQNPLKPFFPNHVRKNLLHGENLRP
jgi:hypothetical protein